MREVILDPSEREVHLEDLRTCQPIFAKRHGKLEGVVLQERGKWILRLGGASASNGWHDTLRECIQTNYKYGYTFFVEEE